MFSQVFRELGLISGAKRDLSAQAFISDQPFMRRIGGRTPADRKQGPDGRRERFPRLPGIHPDLNTGSGTEGPLRQNYAPEADSGRLESAPRRSEVDPGARSR